jgi:hypothetical protein
MSLNNALQFITLVDSDHEFRKLCYMYKSQKDLLEMLKNRDLGFTIDEISDAFNVLLIKCKTYEQAGRVNEIKAWFTVFTKNQNL